MIHGYSGYAHGCRCDICGEGKLAYQRELRARQPGAYRRRKYQIRVSKYVTEAASAPVMVAAFRERLQGVR